MNKIFVVDDSFVKSAIESFDLVNDYQFLTKRIRELDADIQGLFLEKEIIGHTDELKLRSLILRKYELNLVINTLCANELKGNSNIYGKRQKI